jgi:hypothetical protein
LETTKKHNNAYLLLHSSHRSSTTQRKLGTVLVTVFFISFFLVKRDALGFAIHSVQENVLGCELTFASSLLSGSFLQAGSQWVQPGQLGPLKQNSYSKTPKQTTVIFFSSLTKRHIFETWSRQPQCAQHRSPAHNMDVETTCQETDAPRSNHVVTVFIICLPTS